MIGLRIRIRVWRHSVYNADEKASQHIAKDNTGYLKEMCICSAQKLITSTIWCCWVYLRALQNSFDVSHFRRWNQKPDFMTHIVLQIQSQLQIINAKLSSNFLHKLCYRSDIMSTSSSSRNRIWGSLQVGHEYPWRITVFCFGAIVKLIEAD